MFNDYYAVREWLESFIPLVYGKEELGLARIEYLLKLLGNPQKKFKSIHIAGTSGKGSTAFYIAKLLQCRNFELRTPNFELKKVGLHVSPHLVDIRERMQIFKVQSSKFKIQSYYSELMPMNRFVRLMSEIRSVVEKIQKEKPELTPSYFEILVAASFKYFAEEKVDWAVVEVGLGGRLDATNVLHPEISVITNIGLDHTEILGNTIEKIALEKAGIIKRKVQKVRKVQEVQEVGETGIPVVTAATGKALKVIEKVAKEKNSKVIKIDTQKLLKELSIQSYSVGPFLAYEVLKQLKIPVKKKLVRKVFLEKFPGRFEEISDGVVIDGAHNPDKIKALIQWIKEQLTTNNLHLTKRKLSRSVVSGQMSVVLVIAFKKGKDWKKMVDLLIKELPIKKIIATKFWATTDTGKFAAVKPEEIARYASKVKSVQCDVYSNSQEAVFAAINWAGVNLKHTRCVVLVTGSLYLVGEVRTIWHLPSF